MRWNFLMEWIHNKIDRQTAEGTKFMFEQLEWMLNKPRSFILTHKQYNNQQNTNTVHVMLQTTYLVMFEKNTYKT